MRKVHVVAVALVLVAIAAASSVSQAAQPPRLTAERAREAMQAKVGHWGDVVGCHRQSPRSFRCRTRYEWEGTGDLAGQEGAFSCVTRVWLARVIRFRDMHC